MKSTSLLTLLASACYTYAVPLEAGGAVQVGSAVFFDSPDSIEGRSAYQLAEDRRNRGRQMRSTSVPMNPQPTRTVATTTTRAATTTAAPRATQTLNVSGMTYINAMLQSHNIHRPNHTESNLVWNAALAATAQKIGSSCVYQHDTQTDGGGYGQNIGAGAAGNAAASLITNLMYNGEINNFPQPYGKDSVDMSNFAAWGHYSQLAWSTTTDVGCATVYCPNGLKNTGSGVAPYFTVCNYKPPGNYIGQFSKVKAPQGGNTWVVVGS